MTQKLDISLLGPPTVYWNDENISIQRQRARALLYYLAWQGEMIPRETIVGLFWDGNAKTNRSRLTETLSRLRGNLPDGSLIIRRNRQIGLDFEQIFVDKLPFEALLEQAGRIPWQIPENEPLPNDIYLLLKQANDLWRGVWALQGVSFPTSELDHWAQQATERVQGRRYQLLMRLAAHAAVMRDFQAALDYALAAQAYEPFTEDVHVRVLQNLIKLGLLDEARAYYERTKAIMQAELGVAPSERLTQIYKQIGQADNLSLPESEPQWVLHPSLEVPFVGRQDAFYEIQKIIAKKRTVVVVGESGQGKSRLIREFVRQLQPQPRVLLAVCQPLESMQPFQPFVDLFRYHVTDDEWESLPAVWGNYLIGLLPELAQIKPDLHPISLKESDDQAQTMIFESIRQVLLLMNVDRNIFLVIDDAHWADEATLATIAYLAGRAPFIGSANLVLIARQEDLTDSFNEMVVSIQQAKRASIYVLKHLEHREIRNLTNYLLQVEPSEQFIHQMMADSGGNTFFVLEILRAIMDANMGVSSSDTHLPLTNNLRNLILMRIQRLHPEVKETIQVAALIGSEFPIDVLGKACLKTPEELVPILEALEENLLVYPHEQPQRELHYHFAHDKIRETLLQMIPAARSQLLHERILQALNQEPQPAGLLAYHYSGAGELITAFHYWIKAAQRARKLFSKQDALLNYQQADDILQKIEVDLSTKEIYQFYLEWNDLAYTTTETDLLEQIGQKLIQIGNKRGSPLLIGSGLDALSDACMTANDFEAGLAYANQAIEHLSKISSGFELVEAFNHRGTFLYMLNRLKEALTSFKNALLLSSTIRDLRIYKALSNSHYQIALLEVLFGKPVDGYENGVKALEYAQAAQHPYSIVQAYSIQSLSQFYLGEFTEARENAIKGIDLAERIQGWRMLGYLNSYAAFSEIVLGYLDAARQHAESAVQIGQQFEQYDIATLGYRALGEIYRMLYDYPRALHYYQEGLAKLPNHFLGLDNLYRLGLVQHYLKIPNAIEKVLTAQRFIREHGIEIGLMTSKLCLALIYADQEEWEKARPLASELEDETRTRGFASYHISAVCILAEASLAHSEYETALDYLQSIEGERQHRQNPWGEIKFQVLMARALRLKGENSANPGQQIEILLDDLQEHISHPEIRQAFFEFRAKVSARSWIATDVL